MSISQSVIDIESQIFTPAMQEAMRQAQESGYTFEDSIMGASNAHLNMLVELVGQERAAQMLQNQVNFLYSQND